jgi:hypothetical protein
VPRFCFGDVQLHSMIYAVTAEPPSSEGGNTRSVNAPPVDATGTLSSVGTVGRTAFVVVTRSMGDAGGDTVTSASPTEFLAVTRTTYAVCASRDVQRSFVVPPAVLFGWTLLFNFHGRIGCPVLSSKAPYR